MELDQIEPNQPATETPAEDLNDDENEVNQRRPRGRPSKNEEALRKKVKKLEIEKVAIKGKLHEAKKLLKSQSEDFRGQIEEANQEKDAYKQNSEELLIETENIREKFSELQSTTDSLHAELASLKVQLKETELERDELIEQMASSSLNTTDTSIRSLAKGLVLFDRTTKPILAKIDQSNASISWSGEQTTLTSLAKADLDVFRSMDVALLLTCADEIKATNLLYIDLCYTDYII